MRWLTASEAARELNLCPVTVRRLIQRGQLKAFNASVGSSRPTWRISPESLAAFAAARAATPTRPRRRRPRPQPGDIAFF